MIENQDDAKREVVQLLRLLQGGHVLTVLSMAKCRILQIFEAPYISSQLPYLVISPNKERGKVLQASLLLDGNFFNV